MKSKRFRIKSTDGSHACIHKHLCHSLEVLSDVDNIHGICISDTDREMRRQSGDVYVSHCRIKSFDDKTNCFTS